MNEQDLAALEQSARRWTAALDEGARDLPADTLAALYDQRRQAVSRAAVRLHARPAGTGLLVLEHHPGWWIALATLLLLTAIWWMGRSPLPQPLSPQELTELDIKLLTGELPPQVFADWSLVTQENVEAVCLTDS